ncbi:MAG: molecular chaperone [Candidatus Binatia bacterium]|nr:MAG: molecular chaperone [Candidatus Binatia bacterium]
MNLVRWDPFRELEEMTERLNRLFAGTPRRATRAGEDREAITAPEWAPVVDIEETPDEYLIKAEVPGVSRDDVKITVENGVLTLQGERKQEKEEKGRKFHRVERFYGSFLRSFTLPDNVDEEKVRAELKDGVLTVHLPKSEKAKPKAVEVKVA